MEFVGIDIGNYKTVVASSKDNGKIYGDEQGKRHVKTVMELSRPVRKFGNGVTSDVESMLELRFRGFRDDLRSKEGWGHMGMFMKYLDRMIKMNTPTHPPICMSIPVYFKEKERRMLSDIAHSLDLKLEGLFHDISAMGMFACVRRENAPGEFLLFDFGFSKSTAGLFSFEKNVFKPLYMKVIKVGSVQFDEKLINIIIEKYSLSDGTLIREKIRRGLDKIKTTLNSAEYCNVQLFLTENPLDVTITQEEYRRAVEGELNDLSCFINEVMKETEFNGVIEVIGGNSSSFLIKELLNGIEYQVTLDISDSSAIGSALGMACNTLKTKYTLHDIVGREISVSIQDEDVKPTVVFKNTELIVGNPKVITYNRKKGFTLEIIEDGDVISTLVITKDETEEPEAIHISLSINRLGVVCVSNVECKSGAEYKYLPFGINELDVEEIKSFELRYRDEELGLERIGGMRNELETMAVGLGDILYGKFSNVVNDEELNQVKEIAMDLFDIPASETLEQEEKVKSDILSRLEFISKKLDDYRTSTIEDIERCKHMINEFKRENPKIFTPSFYKLQGLLYKIDEYLKGFDLNLFNIGSFDDGFSLRIKADTEKYLAKAKQEVKVKAEMEEQKKKQEVSEEPEENDLKEDLEVEDSCDE